MEFALGVLRWSPRDFWEATYLEVTSAYVGYCRREGLGRWENDGAGMNADAAEQMRRHLEEHRKLHGETVTKRPRDRDQMTKAEIRAYKANLEYVGG